MAKQLTRRSFVGTSIRLAVVSPVIHLGPLNAATPEAAQFPSIERRTLRAAIDVIIPADGRMPAATAVGGLGYVERLVAADTRLRDLIVNGVRALEAFSREVSDVAFAAARGEQQAAALAHVEKADAPAGFVAALRDVVYEAYYTQPRIWKLLGYTFRQSNRRTAPLEPFDQQQVSRVRGMAPFHRQVPT